MKMGRERPVVRWNVSRYLLEQQIEAIRAKLAAPPPAAPLSANERTKLSQQLEVLRDRWRRMGPSPHAKMG